MVILRKNERLYLNPEVLYANTFFRVSEAMRYAMISMFYGII